ncbi:hypothetical protein RHA1_ro06910 [Rhodococcus jostii RHA1]|uniref:Uncharacterized protein n=1 Tax=Rhodococcus jostii (strain RHA1) TaxID=101510 RepID=Q0S1B0_RHOJR|nr:hypothetical protein RHA1_ro06910 [Rhodococcus jostii RHA1]
MPVGRSLDDEGVCRGGEPIDRRLREQGIGGHRQPLDWKWHTFVLSEIACELVIQPGLGSPLFSRWDSIRVGTTLTSKVALTYVV